MYWENLEWFHVVWFFRMVAPAWLFGAAALPLCYWIWRINHKNQRG